MKVLKTVVTVVGVVAAVAATAGLLAPVAVGAALGTVGLSLATVSAIGAAASIAGGILNSLTAKKPNSLVGGSATDWKADPQAGIPYMIGRTFNAGNIVKRESWGTDNEWQGFTTVYSLGPVGAIEQFTADRTPINFTAGGNAIGGMAGWMYLWMQLGLCPTPVAMQNVIGYPGWSATSKLSGLAASNWFLKFDKKAGKKYSLGIPSPGIISTGVFVYDPRLDSTQPGGSGACRAGNEATYVISENPSLHTLTWALGRYQNNKRRMGVGFPASSIDMVSFISWANVCDANNWKIGGIVYSTDDKWNMMKTMAQAGGAEPMQLGGKLSVNYSAPRVSVATITSKDMVGRGTVVGSQKKRDRINGIVPRIKSEAHGWQVVPLDVVRVPALVAEDGRDRTKERDYQLVQQVKQGAELAAYDIYNAREFGPIELKLKVQYIGLPPGSAVTLDIPEMNLNGQKALLGQRTLDVLTGAVSMQFKSETDAKHPFCLGKTGIAPPTPFLTAPLELQTPAPQDDDWIMGGILLTSASGTQPCLRFAGTVDNANAEGVIFEYRIAGTTEWISGSVHGPNTTKADITSLVPGQSYEGSIRYVFKGVAGDRRITAPVATGAITGTLPAWSQVLDDGYKPANNATVGAIIGGNLVTTIGNLPGQAQIITAEGTAAAIAGQAAAATDPTIDSGATRDRFVDTRSTNQPPSWYLTNYNKRTAYEFKDAFVIGVPGSAANYFGALITQSDYSDFTGGPIKQRFTYGMGLAGVSYVRTGTGATWGAWAKDFSGFLRPDFGNSDLLESGATVATLVNFKTPIGTAAAISGQGALATRSDVTDLQLSPSLANRVMPYAGDANFLGAARVAWTAGATVESLKPQEAGSNKTETRIAAAITGQADWATYTGINTANLAGKVTYLDTSGNLSELTRITNRRITLLNRADGVTGVTEPAIVTALGTAAAITGQAATATSSNFSAITGTTKPQSNATNDRFADRRSTNELPSWYRTNFPFQEAREFKDANAIGISGPLVNTYGALMTRVDYNHVSGGQVKQEFQFGVSSGGFVIGQKLLRSATSDAAWGAWERDYNAYSKPYFGSDILEGVGGSLATLGNFKTPLGTAAAISGQGALATRGTIEDGYLSGNLANRLAPHPLNGSFLGAATIAYADGQWVQNLRPTEANANVTETRTAAAISGQAPAATDATIQSGATNDTGADTRSNDYPPLHYRQNWLLRLRTEFKFASTLGSPAGAIGLYGVLESYASWADQSGGTVWQRFTDSAGARFIRYSQGTSPTETWAAWQPEYSGNRKPYFGTDLLEQSGGALATLANFKTPLGIAAAISGQGSLATRSDVTDLQLSPALANRVSPFSGDGNYLSAGRVAWTAGATVESLKPQEAGSNKTETRIAAAITGQAPAATDATIELGADVTSFVVGAATFNIEAASDGTPTAALLPKVVAYKLMKNASDLTSSATWSRTLLSGGLTSTISSGAFSVTGMTTDEAVVRLQATLGSVTRTIDVKVIRNKAAAAPPSGGGTSASTSIFYVINSTSQTVASPELEINVGAGGTATLSAPLEFYALSSVGTFGLNMRWQRWNGSAWVDVGSVATSDPGALRYNEGAGEVYSEPGFINCSATVNGLSGAQKFRLTGYTPAGTVSRSCVGTASAVGS